jgi:hypothetical protein
MSNNKAQMPNKCQSSKPLTTPIEDPAMRGRTWFPKMKCSTTPHINGTF